LLVQVGEKCEHGGKSSQRSSARRGVR
jgi:hypothetical protein